MMFAISHRFHRSKYDTINKRDRESRVLVAISESASSLDIFGPSELILLFFE